MVAFLSACSLTGTALCQLLPCKIRVQAASAYAPLVGLAAFVLLATAIGWAGFGFKTWICLPLTVAVVGAALRFCHDRAAAFTAAAKASAFAILASIGWFLSVIRFQAFNPYNDAYTYLVQAQWLQNHPFREMVRPSGQYPAWTQIALYQTLHLRMGASFLLGWVQAAFAADWSYLVYPVVMAFPLIAAALAVAGTLRLAVGSGSVISWLCGAVILTTLNGFSFGTLLGFLPQTYGIAFAFAGLCLLGMYVWSLRQGDVIRPLALFPVALVFSALLFSYPEIAPLVLIATFVNLLIQLWLTPSLNRSFIRLAAGVSLAVLLVANAEVLRVAESLRIQANAVVGGPVVWTPLQFVAHASGFLSGAWDGSYWTFRSATITELAVSLLLTATCVVLIRYRHELQWEPICPAPIVIGVGTAAWLYFRYVSKSPWTEGVGQSWSQFKISNWTSVFVLFLVTCAIALASRRGAILRSLAILALLLWQASGLAWNYVLADYRTRPFRNETGFNQAPFDSYYKIRSVARLAGREPIYLDLGGQHHKNRQMLTYFLSDRPVISDWSDDGYLFPMLPQADRTYQLEPSMWLIRPASAGSLDSGEQRIGTLSFLRASAVRTQLLAVAGGYMPEMAAGSSWEWTAHKLEYRYRVLGTPSFRVRARFTYLPASPGRHLRVQVSGSNLQTLETLAMQPAWTPVTVPPFEVRSAEFSVVFESDEPPIRLSSSDPRVAAFLIKDLTLEIVE